jgi:hypothetical protein
MQSRKPRLTQLAHLSEIRNTKITNAKTESALLHVSYATECAGGHLHGLQSWPKSPLRVRLSSPPSETIFSEAL